MEKALDGALVWFRRDLRVADHAALYHALKAARRVRGALADRGVALHTSKDHVVFERSEVLTLSGKPYTVFTPYRTAWLSKLDDYFVKPYSVERHAGALAPAPAGVDTGLPVLSRLGFVKTNLESLKVEGGNASAETLLADFLGRIDDYATAR